MGYREQRKKCGYSQKAVADLVGVSISAVSLWESGKTEPTAATLRKLATLYRCTVDELLKEERK